MRLKIDGTERPDELRLAAKFLIEMADMDEAYYTAKLDTSADELRLFEPQTKEEAIVQTNDAPASIQEVAAAVDTLAQHTGPAAESEKPKRTRRTKAQIAADESADAGIVPAETEAAPVVDTMKLFGGAAEYNTALPATAPPPPPPPTTAPVTPPPPPPPVVPAAIPGITFPQFMTRVTAAMTSGKLSKDMLDGAIRAEGLTMLADVMKNPQVIPALAAFIEAL